MTRRLMLLAVLVTTHGADWPGWLGPERNARSAETPTFSATSTRWTTAVGVGYSGVAVVGDTAYTMADAEDRQWVLALDAATGAVRWKHELGGMYEHKMGFHGPRSTPTIAGDRLITITPTGTLLALDRATGSEAWTVDLVERHGAELPSFGFAGSPLVSDGVIYLDIGGSKGGLLAVKLADGTALWQSGTAKAGYSSPIRTTLGGVDQVVFFTGKTVLGAQPSTGTVLWSLPWSTSYDVNAATPLVLGPDRLFVASGYGHGGAEVRVAPGAKDAELAWTTKRMKNKHATSVLHDGHLYGFNETKLTAVDATTGEELWSEDGLGRGTLIGVGDTLIVLAEDCRLLRVKASPKAYKEVSAMPSFSEGPCWTAPALADGTLYLRGKTELTAIDVQ